MSAGPSQGGPLAGRTVGVDIGGTTVKGVLLDPAGRQIRGVSHPTALKGPEGTLAAALDSVRRLLAVDDSEPVAGVGVGVPGQVDADAGVVLRAVNLDIDETPLALRDRLAAALDLPVAVDNDMRVAALGAQRHFAADLPRRNATLAYLGIGTGISAGVVQDGRLIRGRDGIAGEIGHAVVVPDGPVCRCGRLGCLEAVAAGPAFAAAWPHADPQPARALLQAAAGGDAHARAIADRLVGYLASAIQWLMLAHGPDLLVLGGGVGSIGAPLLALVRERIEAAVAHSPLMREFVCPKRLRTAPRDLPLGAIGAAMLASGAGGPTRTAPADAEVSHDVM